MTRHAMAAMAALLFTTGAAAADAPAERYRLEIVAPRALKDRLERDLDLVRWQGYEDITPDLLHLLVEQAKAQAVDIAATEGYFTPTAAVKLDEAQTPPRITLTLEGGPPTRIASVELEVTGPAADDSEEQAQIRRMREEWLLPPGSIFRQADWDASKRNAQRTLAAKRYAAARATASKADIDPERLAADLSMTLDSGPPFRFGELRVKGTQKYREAYVRNLVSFAPGDPYDLERLDQFVRRLNESGYFASARAAIVVDPAEADAAPVDVTVIEAPSKRLSTGIGFSTDTLYRGQLTYNDYNVDNDGLQLLTDLRLEGKEQSATVRLSLPPTSPDHLDAYQAQLAHTDIAGLATQEITGGWERRTLDERNQASYAVRYATSENEPTNADKYSAHALYVEYGHAWRTVDDLLQPTRGTIVAARLGAGIPGASSAGFVRGVVQAIRWFPLGAKTQLSLRGELGAVAINDTHNLPTSLAFRLGGDTTIRGYAYSTLGPREGDATIGGRYYGIASAEVVHWFAPAWGLATFLDAGNAADRLSDLTPVYGFGVGGRIRTPVGPFRVDVAYGTETRAVRLHLSVGLSF